jgi:hypothetical protein
MTSEEKLNIALAFLSNKGAKGGSYDYYDKEECEKRNIANYLFKHLLENGIQEHELLPIIYKLYRDNFLDFFYENLDGEKLGNRPKQIRISFEGIMFIDNKGYVQARLNREAESSRIKFNELIIMIGTGLAGLYALIQFLQWLHSTICH